MSEPANFEVRNSQIRGIRDKSRRNTEERRSDLVVMNNQIIHGSKRKTTKQQRKKYICTYMYDHFLALLLWAIVKAIKDMGMNWAHLSSSNSFLKLDIELMPSLKVKLPSYVFGSVVTYWGPFNTTFSHIFNAFSSLSLIFHIKWLNKIFRVKWLSKVKFLPIFDSAQFILAS